MGPSPDSQHPACVCVCVCVAGVYLGARSRPLELKRRAGGCPEPGLSGASDSLCDPGPVPHSFLS